MTDTGGETTVDDIVVTGQRKQPDGTYPSRTAGGGGGAVPPDGVIRTPIQAGDPPEPPPYVDPCANAASALDWNTDAAAAEANKEFVRRAVMAGETRFDTRERGAFLYRDGTGKVKVGPIHTGDPFDANGMGSVTLTYAGIDPSQIIGAIHSHPRGGSVPSDGDYAAWVGVGDLLEFYGHPRNLAREYVASWPNGGSPTINVYDHRNIRTYDEQNPGNNPVGPEVNPDAQSCP